MKKLIAIVMSVMLLAGLLGVGSLALAENFKEVGHGALSGPHYNLNIIGVTNTKTADMTGTSGHTIFVKLKGKTKINLINSSDPANEEQCNYKDFYVWDRNGTDGEAAFCLPKPTIVQDGECGDNYTAYHYTVFARALGGPGKSFTTTCAEKVNDGGEIYCSSITMVLERKNGQSRFTDVSKYLLFIYADIGEGFKRYPIFDPALEGYYWEYINDNLVLAQLRFYLTPTCVPDADIVDRILSGPDCIEKNGTTTVAIEGFGTHFGTNLDIWVYDSAGKATVDVGTPTVTSDTTLTVPLTPTGQTALGEAVMFIRSGSGSDKETVNWRFEIAEDCNGNG